MISSLHEVVCRSGLACLVRYSLASLLTSVPFFHALIPFLPTRSLLAKILLLIPLHITLGSHGKTYFQKSTQSDHMHAGDHLVSQLGPDKTNFGWAIEILYGRSRDDKEV